MHSPAIPKFLSYFSICTEYRIANKTDKVRSVGDRGIDHRVLNHEIQAKKGMFHALENYPGPEPDNGPDNRLIDPKTGWQMIKTITFLPSAELKNQFVCQSIGYVLTVPLTRIHCDIR